MLKYLFFLLFVTFLFSEELITEETESGVDCLILQDENSIICKYEHERLEVDQEVLVQWINPEGEISRERTVVIPAGHGSIYDFRYIEGRMKGVWQFKVVENKKEFVTKFTLE